MISDIISINKLRPLDFTYKPMLSRANNIKLQIELKKEFFPHALSISACYYTDPPYNNNTYRRSKLILIFHALLNNERFRSLSRDEQNNIIQNVECGCYDYTLGKSKLNNGQANWNNSIFKYTYSNIIHTKTAILNDNQEYIEQIIDGIINPYEIDKIDEDEDIELKERINIRKNQEIAVRTTKAYICPKCSKNECVAETVQSRSGDEGKSIQLNCVFCDHTWMIT